jgi:hypothetical protein
MLLNAVQKQSLFKIAVYGRGGVGKTRLGVTAPKPLYILTERQGFETIRAAAAQLGIPVPVVIWIQNLGQLRAIAKHLRGKSPKTIEGILRDAEIISDEDLAASGFTRDELVAQIPYGCPESIVIDMLGEIAEWVGAEVDEQGGMEIKNGVEGRKINAWTPIQKRVTSIIRTFRDMPYHVLFLCHDRLVGGKDDDELSEAQVWPKMPGRELHKVLMQSVNAMGRMRVAERIVEKDGKPTKSLVRFVEFITSDSVLTKHANPLREREPANFSKWVEALSSESRISDSAEQSAGDDATAPTVPAEQGEKKKRSSTKAKEGQQ